MEKRTSLNRRQFFGYLTLGWVFLAGSFSGLLGMIYRYLYPNVLFEPTQDFVAGKVDDYPEGVDERWKEIYGVWIYKKDGRLVAMSNICTHLGCIPNWLAAEGKFKCPCHGSGYYPNGINFEGPAPRPLERYLIITQADGTIKIDKSKVFRYEKGEWDDERSYVLV